VKILSRAIDIHQKHKLLLAGADKAIDMNEISANHVLNTLKRPKALEVVDGIVYKENKFFFKNEIRIEEIEIPQHSFLDGVYLIETDLEKRHNVITLGLLDNELSDRFIFNVGRHNHKIDAGDILVVIGKLEDIESLKVALNA
jgi:voltage-gated potassium channel